MNFNDFIQKYRLWRDKTKYIIKENDHKRIDDIFSKCRSMEPLPEYRYGYDFHSDMNYHYSGYYIYDFKIKRIQVLRDKKEAIVNNSHLTIISFEEHKLLEAMSCKSELDKYDNLITRAFGTNR